ncbi:MAG TPA: hypothetical protein DDY13_09670 [Cytophagales bacterium]|mgnify:FL=1|jgi:hypothetical protein|nr:hypothetical protein [Cytophagales bacterium]
MKFGFFLFALLLSAVSVNGQNAFAETELEYKKPFFKQDMPYVISLGEDNESIALLQDKKSAHLVRYDKYMFEKWRMTIAFDKREAPQQLLLKGDTAMALTYHLNDKSKTVTLGMDMFRISDGKEIYSEDRLLVGGFKKNDKLPGLRFSEDKNHFIFYNYIANNDPEKVAMALYKLNEPEPIKVTYLDALYFDKNRSVELYLRNNMDYVLVSVDMPNFKADYLYYHHGNGEYNKAEDVFSFKRPIEKAPDIKINPIDSSAFYISYSGVIETELAGYHVAAFEGSRGHVIFSESVNVEKEFIRELYTDYAITSVKPKKKRLKTPDALEFSRLVESYVNNDKELVLVFEELETPVYFHRGFLDQPMERKSKKPDEQHYMGGDIIVFAHGKSGQTLWHKVIQKYQKGKNSPHALSFVPYFDGKTLSLLTWETSNKGSFYISRINTLTGEFGDKTKLLGSKMYDFTKSYSAWLNEDNIYVGTVKVNNSGKRTIYLIELNH